MCDLGGSGYCLWGLERKMCEKSLGDNSDLLDSLHRITMCYTVLSVFCVVGAR